MDFVPSESFHVSSDLWTGRTHFLQLPWDIPLPCKYTAVYVAACVPYRNSYVS